MNENRNLHFNTLIQLTQKIKYIFLKLKLMPKFLTGPMGTYHSAREVQG